MEVDELFHAAETLQLLRFAELAEGDLKLTDAGRRFVEAGADERKAQFAQHLVAFVPLAAHIKHILDERPTHRAPIIRFKDELENSMPEEEAERTLHTVINWARYAEVLASNGESGMVSWIFELSSSIPCGLAPIAAAAGDDVPAKLERSA